MNDVGTEVMSLHHVLFRIIWRGQLQTTTYNITRLTKQNRNMHHIQQVAKKKRSVSLILFMAFIDPVVCAVMLPAVLSAV
jgi:hypothetical protein